MNKLFFLISSILFCFCLFGCGIAPTTNITVSGNATVNETQKHCSNSSFYFTFVNDTLTGSVCVAGGIDTISATNVSVNGSGFNSTEINDYLIAQGFITEDELSNYFNNTSNSSNNNSSNNSTDYVDNSYNACGLTPSSWNVNCDKNSFITIGTVLGNITLVNSTINSVACNATTNGYIANNACNPAITYLCYSYKTVHNCAVIVAMNNCVANGASVNVTSNCSLEDRNGNWLNQTNYLDWWEL